MFDELSAEQLAAVAGGPLCCTECGAELELRCGNRHRHQAKNVYRDKPCACGATFTPTGPRDTKCPNCKAAR